MDVVVASQIAKRSDISAIDSTKLMSLEARIIISSTAGL
jgi:hypothetical protein